MKKLISVILIILLLSGCSSIIPQEIIPTIEPTTEQMIEQTTEPIKEVHIFVSQGMQPIEESPYLLPLAKFSESTAPASLIKMPKMNEETTVENVVDTLLCSNELIVNLTEQELEKCIFINPENYENNTITQSIEDGYLAIRSNRGIFIEFPGLENRFYERDGDANSADCAILIKHRYIDDNQMSKVSYSNSNIDATAFFESGRNMNAWAGDRDAGSYFEKYNVASITPIPNEWYYTYVAMDKNLEYVYLTWQENNPKNYAFYSNNYGSLLNVDREQLGKNIRLCIDINTNIDIEFAQIFEKQYNEAINENNQTEQIIYEYTNDEEKYQLASDLFNDEDYYNSYLLFNEMSEYQDSQYYLAECKRLLTTIEISNPYVVGAIQQSFEEKGIPMHDYLYAFQAEKLETLDLAYLYLDDYSFLSLFPNLNELILNNNAICDLSFLNTINNLEKLNLANNNIDNLINLSNLVNLKELDLSNNFITDVSYLGLLTSLEKLDLSTNEIKTVNGLENLVNLVQVNLNSNFIDSLDGLNPASVKELNIMNTNINDLSAIADFNILESLTAGFQYMWLGDTPGYLIRKKYESEEHYFTGLTGLEYLSNHPTLKSLNLAGLNTESVEPLGTIPTLESLIIKGSSGGKYGFEVFNNLENLKELQLSGWGHTGLNDLSFLYNLPMLEVLCMQNIQTDDYTPIGALTKLKELRVHNNSADTTYLTNLVNLETFCISNSTFIHEFKELENLNKLEYFESDQSDFFGIEALCNVESLKYLSITGEVVPWNDEDGVKHTIEDIRKLTNLECCYINARGGPDGGLQSVFAGLENLKYVNACVLTGVTHEYRLGNDSIKDEYYKPNILDLSLPSYQTYTIWDEGGLDNLSSISAKENFVIVLEPQEGNLSAFNPDSVTLNIPYGVKNLYIFSRFNHNIDVDLNFLDPKAVERVSFGMLDITKDTPFNSGIRGRNYLTFDNYDCFKDCMHLTEIYINNVEIKNIDELIN